jgi:hypothetical protein
VPSRRSGQVFGGSLVLLLLTMCPAGAQEPRSTAPISQEEITAAAAAVKRDPNLGGERTMKMLRWRQSGQSSNMDLSWLSWIAGFFNWTMESARYLMWAAIVFFAAWLGVHLMRALRHWGPARATESFVVPTHVRDLDIRPESLPANIGAAARALWDRGEHRAALSLLYRGLLSRLTHVHRLPIQDSTTEGDCLSLLPGRVPPTTGEYSTRLVDAWRAFVYGGSEAASPVIYALCDGFAGALDRAAAAPIEGGTE